MGESRPGWVVGWPVGVNGSLGDGVGPLGYGPGPDKKEKIKITTNN